MALALTKRMGLVHCLYLIFVTQRGKDYFPYPLFLNLWLRFNVLPFVTPDLRTSQLYLYNLLDGDKGEMLLCLTLEGTYLSVICTWGKFRGSWLCIVTSPVLHYHWSTSHLRGA